MAYGFAGMGWFNGFVAHDGDNLAYVFTGMAAWLSFLQPVFFLIKIVIYLEEDKDMLLSNVWTTFRGICVDFKKGREVCNFLKLQGRFV